TPRLVGFVRDVTAARQARAALETSERHFRAMAEAMPQLVWTSHPDGREDWHNQRWHGEADSTSGSGFTSWRDLLHPEDLERTNALWEAALRTGAPFATECRFRAFEGGYKWHLCRALAVRDQKGRIERWFGTCTDISEIVAARETMAQSRVELERQVAE